MRSNEKTEWTWDEGWPCQRLRIGWALVLFYFFETLIGQQLPIVLPLLMLGFGVTFIVSAMFAIHEWKLEAQLAVIQEALDSRPR